MKKRTDKTIKETYWAKKARLKYLQKGFWNNPTNQFWTRGWHREEAYQHLLTVNESPYVFRMTKLKTKDNG